MTYCCYGCVPPKREPGCHSTCPEYRKQKAEHDALKAKADEQRRINGSIYYSRGVKVEKALRYRRNKKL
jgi:hypothetical protein